MTDDFNLNGPASESSPDQRGEGPAAAGPNETPGPPEPLPSARVPEDLRVPWSWLDVALFLIVAVGSLFLWSLVVGFGLGITAAARGMKLAEVSDQPTVRTAVLLAQQVLWYGTLLLYLLLTIRVSRQAPFWRTLGWRPVTLLGRPPALAYVVWTFAGMALAVIIQVAMRFIGPKTGLPIEQFFRTRASVWMMMVMALFVAPLVEEVIFRGYFYPVLARTFGVLGGVLVTGLAFGLMHAAQLWGGWGQISLLVVAGTVFTAVRARTGSIAASYFLHLGYNFLIFLTLYAASDGFRRLPGAN